MLGLLLIAATTVGMEVVEAENVEGLEPRLLEALGAAIEEKTGRRAAPTPGLSAGCSGADCRTNIARAGLEAAAFVRAFGGPTRVLVDLVLVRADGADVSHSIALPRTNTEHWRAMFGEALEHWLPPRAAPPAGAGALRPPASPAASAPSDGSLAWILLGAGAAALLSSVGLSLVYASTRSDLAEQQVPIGEQRGAAATANTHATLAVIALAAGVLSCSMAALVSF